MSEHKYKAGMIMVYGKYDRQIFKIETLSRGYNNVLRYQGINGFGDTVSAHENKMRPANSEQLGRFVTLTMEALQDE